MGLFTPGYFAKDQKKRVAAIQRLDDKKRIELFQGDLNRYSKDAYAQQRLRLEILEEIRDQVFHASLLVALDKLPNADVQFIETSTRRLIEPALVNALYVRLSNRQIADRLIDRVTDPTLLKRIALDSTMTGKKRVSAIQNLKDADTAAQVLLTTKTYAEVEDACAQFLRPGDTALADELARRFLNGQGLSGSVMKYAGKYARDPGIAAAAKKELLGKPGYRTDDLLGLLHDTADMKDIVLGTNDLTIACRAARALAPDSAMLLGLIEALQPGREHIRRELLLMLAAGKDEKNIPYFCGFLDAADDDTVELGLTLLARTTGLSRDDVLGRYGTTRCVKLCMTQLENAKMRYANLDSQIRTLKVLYTAGIGREEIGSIAGKKLRSHTDENYSYCNPGHSDGHDDLPEAWFTL